jgi:peptidyl-tRNA hydrolase
MISDRWKDYDITPHYARDDNDAYSLPVVVRVERNVDYSEEDAFLAVSAAITNLFSENSKSEEWNSSVEAWMRGRIRKVVRKARGAAWDKLFELDHIYAKHNNVEVMIFAPHRLDEPLPAEIKKLQVQGIDFVPASPTSGSGTRLGVSVNPDIKMSTGKTLAQVGHAVQIAILQADASIWDKWFVDSLWKVSIEPWDTMPDNSFDVIDAGLTEIPAGSLTVKSFWFLDK